MTAFAMTYSDNAEASLDLRRFLERFGVGLHIRTVAKLHRLFGAMGDASNLEQRLEWMERLASWILRGGELGGGTPAQDEPPTSSVAMRRAPRRRARAALVPAAPDIAQHDASAGAGV